MSALTIENVIKKYDDLLVVDDVCLNVEAGERVALLGHNGAGKTTLMRMILGLTAQNSGTIEILGTVPGSYKARSSISFLPENVAFHGSLTGREQMHHFAKLKSVSTNIADGLLERVGLVDAADRAIRTYSKGMRQRVGLAQALIGKPQLALLDEPTSGLDPISRHEFYDIVEELANSGTAVLLSSHALTELETRTDRIAIMSKGKLVADDTLNALRHNSSLPIRINVKTTPKSVEQVRAALNGRSLNGVSVELTCSPANKVETLGQIMSLGKMIEDVDIVAASLEDLYRHYSAVKKELN